MAALHASHRTDPWRQFGLTVTAGDGGRLAVDETQRCERCQMAVRIGDELTPVGERPCIGAPAGGRRP